MFTPTAEQQFALELFATGQSLAIEAGAGTGKTSTLKLLAESTHRRGQYVAFNKAIVDEAGQKMPGTVTCSTAHSLAYRAVGADYSDRLRSSSRMRSIDLANKLKVDAIPVTTFDGTDKLLSQTFLAGVVMRAVTRFCQSADAAPNASHVPYIPGLDEPANALRPTSRTVNREVAKILEPAVIRAWADLSRYDGVLPYKHDHYLKAWQLSDPKIGADYILFDEAQDANPVMVAIVAAQTHAQLVWVGDSQQQIYTFTGAVNALANVPAENRAFLTQSFRFGPAVADVANSMLDKLGAELRLTGTDTIASVVGPVAEPNVILTRTNAMAVRTVLEHLRNGKKVHLVGGATEIVRFAKAARDLMRNVKTDHPELACFDNWAEVQNYVAEDEQGSDLKLLVGLIDEFGVAVILDALDNDTREQDADVVVSTAHKSKGREWNRVQLAGDFPAEPQDEELRLLYVACTRAIRELDIESAPFIRDGYVPSTHTVVATTSAKAAVAAPAKTPVAKQTEGPALTGSLNEHFGRVGERVNLELTVERVNPTPTKYGAFLTGLRDSDGRAFTWFAKELYAEGTAVSGSFEVKSHGEFRGALETTITRGQGIEVTA